MKYWIYFVVCGFVFFFVYDEEGISVFDIVAAVGYNFALLFWFFVKVLVRTDKVLYNFKLKEIGNNSISPYKYIFDITDINDKLFILFFILLGFNVFIAVFNGVPVTDWLREYMLWTLMLYYFPLREYFKDIKSINILLTLLGIIVLIIDFKQFYNWFKMIKNVFYAFEIGDSTIRLNHEIYVLTIITSIALFFYTSTKKAKWFALIVAMITSAALLSTLARAYWGTTMLAIFLLLFFLKWKQIVLLLSIIATTTGIILFCIYTFFPTHSELITGFIVKRFQSSTKVRTDPSLNSRRLEFAVVYDGIIESPIYGHGLRHKFSFQNNIPPWAKRTHWIHNGYLNFSYKAGIPMAILFYLTMILFFIKGTILSLRMRKINKILDVMENNSDNSPPADLDHNGFKIYSALVYSSTLTLMILLITNFLTSSFILRAGLFVTAFILAFIYLGGVEFNKIKEKLELKT